jgi:hypothetical protein
MNTFPRLPKIIFPPIRIRHDANRQTMWLAQPKKGTFSMKRNTASTLALAEAVTVKT